MKQNDYVDAILKFAEKHNGECVLSTFRNFDEFNSHLNGDADFRDDVIYNVPLVIVEYLSEIIEEYTNNKYDAVRVTSYSDGAFKNVDGVTLYIVSNHEKAAFMKYMNAFGNFIADLGREISGGTKKGENNDEDTD